MRLVFHYKAVNINTSTGQVPGQPTGQVKKQSHSELYNITRQPTGQVPGQPTGQPFEQINEIIHALGNSELSSRELMNKLRLKGRDNFLKMYLYPAIEYGFIEVRYPDQPNHPKQKYYLTERNIDYEIKDRSKKSEKHEH